MKREHPLGAELGPTIDRLRTIAAQAGDALLTEGPVHPNHQLLDLCAEALYHRRLYDKALATYRKNNRRRDSDAWKQGLPYCSDAEHAASRAEFDEAQDFSTAMRRVLLKAKKLKATTAAGIYAKALIVRSSRSGAMLLAMSLADDLIACPGLRASLWPAGEEACR